MNSMITDIKDAFAPTWTHRRIVIKATLVVAMVLLFLLLGGTIYLAYIGKFGLYASAFFITFLVCDFMTIIGVIGAYVFGSRWETKDFLSVLPSIIPSLTPKKERDNDWGFDNHSRDYGNSGFDVSNSPLSQVETNDSDPI